MGVVETGCGRGREKLGLKGPALGLRRTFFVPRAVLTKLGLYSPNAHFTAGETKALSGDVTHTRPSTAQTVEQDPGSHRPHY